MGNIFKYPNNGIPFIGFNATGFDYVLSYENGVMTCKPSRGSAIFVISICSIFGPGMMARFYFDPNSTFENLPLFPKIAVAFFCLVSWWGIYASLFIHPRILFDSLEGKIDFYDHHQPFFTIRKDQIKGFDLREVIRTSTSSKGAGSQWTGYIVYVQRTEGKDLDLAETANKTVAEGFLSQIKTHFWKEAV
jgi:hypothetical protein